MCMCLSEGVRLKARGQSVFLNGTPLIFEAGSLDEPGALQFHYTPASKPQRSPRLSHFPSPRARSLKNKKRFFPLGKLFRDQLNYDIIRSFFT